MSSLLDMSEVPISTAELNAILISQKPDDIAPEYRLGTIKNLVEFLKRCRLTISDYETKAALSQQEAVTLDNAPIGTKAPSHTGGYWIRVERGWKWNTGATFGRPGGDWTGELIPPSHPQPQKVESKVPQSVEEFKALIGEYFELGVAEGAEGRNHDTKDHAAQRKLDEINSALAGKELVPDWLKEFMRDKEAIECILEWAQNEEQIVNVGNVSGERDELLESSAGWVTRLLKAMLSASQEGV